MLLLTATSWRVYSLAGELRDGAAHNLESSMSELSIQILPPVWFSKWAFLVWIMLLVAIVFMGYFVIRRRQKQELAMKQMEFDLQKYEMEKERIKIFTMLDHNIKRSLPSIITPLEKLRKSPLPTALRTDADMAWQNAKLLNDRILDLLEYSSIENMEKPKNTDNMNTHSEQGLSSQLMKEDYANSGDETAETGEASSPTLMQPGKPVVLVVQDNSDERRDLQHSLEDDYHIVVADNSKEALQVLSSTDDVKLIIGDDAMPQMNGIELMKQIKKDALYAHIPVILLTARSSEADIVEGLQTGVADYITKPFSTAVLRLRVKKIIEWTNDAHENMAMGSIDIKPSEITVSSLDEELVKKVVAVIEKNIQNANFTVVQLSSAVNMTRGNLYKKLMAIVGKSPVEFMRNIRLERGKSLLDQGRTNISEVSNMVGISPKLFAQYFKNMYGDTPSDYLKKKKR